MNLPQQGCTQGIQFVQSYKKENMKVIVSLSMFVLNAESEELIKKKLLYLWRIVRRNYRGDWWGESMDDQEKEGKLQKE